MVELAWVCSGDKGELANIGVAARKPEYLPYLTKALSGGSLLAWYSHVIPASSTPRIDFYTLPEMNSLNIVMHDVLVGGAVSSHRFDPMGKSFGQQLIDFPVAVSPEIARQFRESFHAR